MDICTTSQFICSLKHPETRLRTLHNLICIPESFLCNKHIATMQGHLGEIEYIFYAPITKHGAEMLRRAAEQTSTSGFSDLRILDNEIIYSGLNTGSCCLAMETLPDGVRLSEAIYSVSKSKLLKGLKLFKASLKRLDISHNNINTNNIIIDIDYEWYSICNYNVEQGFGNDKTAFAAIERAINNISLPDEPSAKNPLHCITTDDDGNTIYPIVESCRRFTSKQGVGFKDKNDVVIIKDDYLWASDFCCNRAVVKLKNSKMGVIDRKGRYIIEAKYNSIDYNPTDGISIVREGELQTRFNYLGEQLEEWHK
ncbi:MAG: WG repeat-containing protein [Alistipes sp.]|nr:WG repeat-containing protein [Alistipes sp.]